MGSGQHPIKFQPDKWQEECRIDLSKVDNIISAKKQHMDITDQKQHDLFKQLARHATQGQQRQIIESGTPAQIRLFANTIDEMGKKINKQILDNLYTIHKEEALRSFAIAQDNFRGVKRDMKYYNQPVVEIMNIELSKTFGESHGKY